MTKECFINGVQYKCRTCFDPATTLHVLAEECSNYGTCQELLNDIVKLKTNDDELLPKTICSKCLKKLVCCYDFILHIQNVNEKYLQLLESGKNSFRNDGLASTSRNITERFGESATALPLDQYVSKIKFEDEFLMSFDIVSNSDDRRNDSVKEDTYDPYMEHLMEDIELSSDKLQYQRRSPNEEINQVLEDDVNDYDSENSSTSTADESDYLIEKRKKKDKMNKSGQRLDKNKNDEAKIDKHYKSFLCYICNKSFPELSRLREHMQDMHENKTNPRTKPGSSSSSDSEPDLPNSQTYGKKSEEQYSKYFQIEKVNGNFVCGVCKQSFTLQNSCRRHIVLKHSQAKLFQCRFCDRSVRCKEYLTAHIKRLHPGESFESNTQQLARLFGERLYSRPLLLPRLECKLCDTIFVTKKKLLQHLDSHSEASTLHSLKLSSDVIQRWFSNMSDIQDIKTTICKDIREKNLFKYYTMLNDFSYEISISDTDAEDLEEETAAPVNKKYKCELCAKEFLYKYQVFAHLREDHWNEDIPLKCSHCNLEFISIKMYEQHKQTHCRNEHKLFLCPNCNGKFVWLENMKKHNCVTKVLDIEKSLNDKIKERYNEVTRSSPKTVIRCGLCEMIFEKLRDLRKHMPLHGDGKTGVDFDGCIYVNQFETSSSNRELLEQNIKNAFTKRQISQLYQAIDKDGKEMDISDSDTDEDDADGEKSYLCELCYEKFKKRKLLFNHQKEHHKDVSMPFTCKECKMQYVSIDLLQQHIKRECWNEHRRAAEQCDCCKERFIWPENMLRHREIQRYTSIKNLLYEDLCRTQAKKTMASSSSSDNIQICHCFLCPKIFSNINHLNDHLMRHRLTLSTIKTVASTIHSTWWPNGRKIIKCKICNQEFSSITKLNEHYSLKNLKNVCGAMQHSLANYSITNQMGFELHLELDSETETEYIENEENKNLMSYSCCMCNKSFKRKYEISQHQRSMHSYELLELKCERCVFRTVSEKVLDYHRMSQCFDVEKKYQCHQCNFKFMWQENLENHISIFHNSNDFFKTLDAANTSFLNDASNINAQCLQLKENSHNDVSLALHQNYSDAGECVPSKDTIQCLICGIYINKNDYSEHIRRHKCDKSYKCTFCEMVFLTRASLRKHKRMRHKLHSSESPKGQMNSLSTLEKNLDSTGSTQHPQGTRKFKLCPICGVYRRNIEIHIRSHMEETPFKCDLCDKIFSTEINLYVHRRTHSNKRPFKCTLCEKAFVHEYRLKAHMRSHTGERPYECTVCQKKFINLANLKHHSLNHTGKKSFICEICNRAFKCAPYLKRHRIRKGHHSENN